ncbi:MAG: F0F1 ATP synthase subunit B [Phycisphaeraceae bacterium]|nr:F0F1 ATP synthase subunit B [Phycisphaeraceae bacterium]
MRNRIFLAVMTNLLVPAAAWAEQTVETAHEVAQEAAAHGTAAHEAHRGLLDVVASEMIWSIVVFGVFFGVLSFLVWPKILKGLRAREQKLHDDLEHAEQAAKKAADTLAKIETRLAAAQAEARQLIDRSRGEAEKLAGQIKADAEREGLALRQRAQKEIESATEQAVAQLHAEAASLATQIAGKILHRTINENDQRALVSEALAELSRGQGKN